MQDLRYREIRSPYLTITLFLNKFQKNLISRKLLIFLMKEQGPQCRGTISFITFEVLYLLE